MPTGIFDLTTPLDFFNSINRIFDRYKSGIAKNIEDLLYIIMGLNHLREWIAPGYDPKHTHNNPEEEFSHDIYLYPSHEIIRNLCNHTKHLNRIPQTTDTQYGLPVSKWPKVSAVRQFSLGPASDYVVDGRNVIDIIDEVIQFYENNWFK